MIFICVSSPLKKVRPNTTLTNLYTEVCNLSFSYFLLSYSEQITVKKLFISLTLASSISYSTSVIHIAKKKPLKPPSLLPECYPQNSKGRCRKIQITKMTLTEPLSLVKWVCAAEKTTKTSLKKKKEKENSSERRIQKVAGLTCTSFNKDVEYTSHLTAPSFKQQQEGGCCETPHCGMEAVTVQLIQASAHFSLLT